MLMISGIEVCPGRSYSLREVHVTADISIAILQHLYTTRNRSKLADSRYADVLVGIAEYWVSRMTLNEKTNLYEVYGKYRGGFREEEDVLQISKYIYKIKGSKREKVMSF